MIDTVYPHHSYGINAVYTDHRYKVTGRGAVSGGGYVTGVICGVGRLYMPNGLLMLCIRCIDNRYRVHRVLVSRMVVG